MNKSDIAKLVGLMAAAYPNSKVSDATIEVYVSMLGDIPLDILTASIQQCMVENDFIPSIAKIREKALVLCAPVALEPLEAWGIVQKEIDRTGFYHSPTFADPIIAKAVDCIGWKELCSSENQIADRAHFSKVYEGLIRQADNDRKLLPQARELKQSTERMLEGRTMPKGELKRTFNA